MSNTPLRLVFAGTPAFAADALKALADNPDCELVAVYTQPDRRANRGKKLSQSDVKKLALELNLAVLQPENFKNPDSIKELAGFQADVMVVAAYGLLLPEEVLQTPKYGCINIHASLLPRWRGAAPIERAIEAGDSKTGVTIMQMDKGLDTGDMLHIVETPIHNTDSGDSLRARLSELGARAINKVISELASNHGLCGEKQNDSLATYAKKLLKPEAEINWGESAEQLERRIRAFNSHNPCFTLVRGERLRILNAEVITPEKPVAAGTILSASKVGIVVACGDKALQLKTLQLPGGKALDCQAMLNGKADWFKPGTQLGEITKS